MIQSKINRAFVVTALASFLVSWSRNQRYEGANFLLETLHRHQQRSMLKMQDWSVSRPIHLVKDGDTAASGKLQRLGRQHAVSSSLLSDTSYPTTSDSDSVAPWRTSKLIPHWMKAYFQWHQDALQKIKASKDEDSWKQFDFVVSRCLEQDAKCGGGADRLKPLPYLILFANRTQRLLFIKWERPAALEEFLLPPRDGLDWRWPPAPSLANHSFSGRPDMTAGNVLDYHMGYIDPETSPDEKQKTYPDITNKKIVSVRYQSHNHGRHQYDNMRPNNRTDALYVQVFRDVWYSTFVPSPPVQKRIDDKMGELQLEPEQFHSIHIRSRYIYNFREKKIRDVAANSINCLQQIAHQSGTSLKNHTPIFVSSDGRAATQATIEYAHQKGLFHIITKQKRHHPHVNRHANNHNNTATAPNNIEQAEEQHPEPLHLDRGSAFLSTNAKEFTKHEPHEFYDTFVDLYILSHAKCNVFGHGNYGRWANTMSKNISCHRDTAWGDLQRCEWDSFTKEEAK